MTEATQNEASEDDDSLLIQELHEMENNTAGQSKASRSLLRSHIYQIPLDGDLKGKTCDLVSWRMQDYAYKQDPCPFPTRARGLFTSEDSKIKQKIVVRGYDKFFNTAEVSWTKWENIENFTQAPFYLTIKSNGCIIFIAALTETQLIVTSKHAWGESAADKDQPSHAHKGEEWLDRSLAKANKTRQDLCDYLWRNKCTAVAELCDDAFEEHVLAYSQEETGLHLHGVNANCRHLRTLLPEDVTKLAHEFGFIPTQYIAMQTVQQVKTFTDECARDDGRWNGTHIEGFVVRSAAKTTQTIPTSFGQETFMFKVKFEQPYLRWREWRELTRRMLSNFKAQVAATGKAQKSIANKKKIRSLEQTEQHNTTLETTKDQQIKATSSLIPSDAQSTQNQSTSNISPTSRTDKTEASIPDDGLLYGINIRKIKHPQTLAYVHWTADKIAKSPAYFDDWQHSRGIVQARNDFLSWLETHPSELSKYQTSNESSSLPSEQSTGPIKTLIVPIAVPGCGGLPCLFVHKIENVGKTAVGIALASIFGFAHTQADDVQAKSTKALFLSSVTKLFQSNDVVFADRNNHLLQHRVELIKLCLSKQVKQFRIRRVALVWDVDSLPSNEIQQVCADRILDRGDKHQTLRAEAASNAHEAILRKFIREREPFDEILNGDSDGQFQTVIKVDPLLDRFDMLQFVSSEFLRLMPDLPPPTKTQLRKAEEHAAEYMPTVIKEMKAPAVRYYGIAVDIKLEAFVRLCLPPPGQLPAALASVLDNVSIVEKPHITLCHHKEVETSEEVRQLWDACAETLKNRDCRYQIILGPRLAYNGRVIALEVSAVRPLGDADTLLPKENDKQAFHVTVGFTKEATGAVEGKFLVSALLNGEETTSDGHEVRWIDIGAHAVAGHLCGMH